ncbi:MAG: vanadium-dependent haloperoxidase [Akkermansiaceae bacterium]|nr:vanadium-dependent haloperoxidase [Akkermansiaceae bacterium]
MPLSKKHPHAVPSSSSLPSDSTLRRPSAVASHNRRGFLRTFGLIAAAGTTSVPALAKQPSSQNSSSRKKRGLYGLRRSAARARRFRAALNQSRSPDPQNTSNRDESTLDRFIGNFSKGLPHNAFGEVDPAAYGSLLRALPGRDPAAWEAIPLAGSRKLANPQASLAYCLTGGDSHASGMPAPPTFRSEEEAAEMAEVYLHAILRDVPFDEYAGSSDASFAAAELNTFSDFRGPKDGGAVTPQTLFRGSFDGDLAGNYLSQFLLLDVPQGAAVLPQKYQTTVPGDDFMLNQAEWLSILEGHAPAVGNSYRPAPRYITTARDLGEYVHRDYTYQTYLQAALILLGLNAPLNINNPYEGSATQGGFVTFGAAEILALLAEASLNGLKAAWYHKWQVHRRVRPEVFAGRVHFVKTGAKAYPVNPELLNSAVLDEVAARFGGGYWLPMAYPEGSPTHPAYPAGHAVVAGACITILKALFDQTAEIIDPVEVVPGSGGNALQNYTGGDTLTVGGELNKLANNIAIGRNLAGVHWRTDGTEGILLGEDVAVRMLQDYKLTYYEKYIDFSFTGFGGNTIVI